MPDYGNLPPGCGGIPDRTRRKDMFDFLKNLLKTSNDAQIKKLQKTVDQINALEE